MDGLLLEESHDFLVRACSRIYTGNNTSQPDVMLKVENEKLPAHRTLLAESSVVFEAMFQARYFHLCMLPYSVFGASCRTHGFVPMCICCQIYLWNRHPDKNYVIMLVSNFEA